jgi:CMP-N,N'-diacetyllegionaminic acid synthase
MNTILVTICARGGSKGIPGKNIKRLNGLPLIAYTIKAAKLFSKKYGADIVLSTDDESIKSVAASFGIHSEYIRPPALATDVAGKVEAITDVVIYEEKARNCQYEYILDLDVSSPLRTLDDLSGAFEQLKNNKEALNIFSVNTANRNPYFNMVELGSDGFYHVVKELRAIKSRQEAPQVYDMNASFYIFRRSFFTLGCKTTTTKKSLIFLMDHVCFDLDHPHDFILMEIVLKENLIKLDI